MNDGTFKATVSMQRRLLVINWYSPPGSDGTSSHCVNSLTCGYQYQTKLLQYIIRMAFNKTTVQNHSKDTAQDAKPSVVQFCHSKETKVWRIQNKYKSTCRQKQTKRLLIQFRYQKQYKKESNPITSSIRMSRQEKAYLCRGLLGFIPFILTCIP